MSCGQCTRWHRLESGAGYKYWTHESERFHDQEAQHPYVEVHHPYEYKVLSATGTDSRILRDVDTWLRSPVTDRHFAHVALRYASGASKRLETDKLPNGNIITREC